MLDDEPRPSVRYCAVIQIDKKSDKTRITSIASRVVEMINGWSKGENELLFASSDCATFGYFFRSTKPADMMRSEFIRAPGVWGADYMVLFEANRAAGTIRTTNRAEVFLQHH